MTEDTFEAKQRRSPNVYEMQRITQAMESLNNLSVDGAYFENLSVTVKEQYGDYVLGEIWWDPESEVYRLDLSRYGSTE